MPDWGKYKVVVTDPSSGATTAVSFYVRGWGYAPWSMEHPDRIEIEMNQDQYQPGDEAQVLIKAPFSGKLLLTVEREKLYDSQLITMDENTATIPIKVKAEYLPNAYVTATLIRSPESMEEYAPARAFGTAPLFINVKDYKLQVNVEKPVL